jgi:hypothetical protein
MPPHHPITLSPYRPIAQSLLLAIYLFSLFKKSATLRQIVNFALTFFKPPILRDLKYPIILGVYKIQQKSAPWQEICLFFGRFHIFLLSPGACLPCTSTVQGLR